MTLLLVARNDSFCQKLYRRMCNLSTNEDQHTPVFTRFNTNQRTKEHKTLFITDLLESDGFDSLMVMVDHGSTKGVISIPCNKTIDATLMAQNYIDHVYRCFGLPDSFLSDRGPQFSSQVFREMV